LPCTRFPQADALQDLVTSPALKNLEKLIGTPRDGALQRFSLGSEYLKEADPQRAAQHLSAAVEKDPQHSAAWKLLGKALAQSGRFAQALEAWKRGMEVAQSRGDIQAVREMAVFARRAENQLRQQR
jgi:Tfp pilus assembly protein PilF